MAGEINSNQGYGMGWRAEWVRRFPGWRCGGQDGAAAKKKKGVMDALLKVLDEMYFCAERVRTARMLAAIHSDVNIYLYKYFKETFVQIQQQ